MLRTARFAAPLAVIVLVPSPPGAQGLTAQTARISEEVRTLDTYPFSEPNPIPILTRDERLYPYHSFDGYAVATEPRDWTVVHLENDYIEVFVLPEVGGKVWGAVVKATGHEFILRNEVMKFRNIALRGPWTSGGIEFNFGVIGHTPATATPVDYLIRTNADGSVSCIVGAMDLPSRTRWRVEIRLPPDKAYFETHVSWTNPTLFEQPYYNWMTGAAAARDDLRMTMPGTAYLQHSGAALAWPVDSLGRDLALYRNNTFEGNKSYHVVGELDDFFGGYYHDADYGFGHWARYEDMPGQKLWLWALSREGGIWEQLLTDTDGQYVEFQAGRLFVQYSPGPEVNPITQAGFDPLSASRWTETWFPLEGTGGLTDASRDGALSVAVVGAQARIGLNAFTPITDTVWVWSGDRLAAQVPIQLEPLEPFATSVQVDPGARIRVEVPALDLRHDSDRSPRALARPFATDPAAVPSIPEVDRLTTQARELAKGRRYGEARVLLDQALAAEPWHRDALLAMAELDERSGRTEEALGAANRVLQLDAYDAEANFRAGSIYRTLRRFADARDAFGWSARAMAYRSASYTQLAALMIAEGDLREATRYARLALDYDRYSASAWRSLATVGRLAHDQDLTLEARAQLETLDPLDPFTRAEAYLSAPTAAAAATLVAAMGGEYPDQTHLELALEYVALDRSADALAILSVPGGPARGPVQRAWRAYLERDPSPLDAPGDVTLQFPFRPESLEALTWAAAHSDRWEWSYLRALDLWALDRLDEAAVAMRSLADRPDFGPFYAARGHLLATVDGTHPTDDFREAVALAPETRVLHTTLIGHLEAVGAWDDARTALADARRRFPGDFNLALLESRALVHTGRAAAATAILDTLQVLPSEHARESHQLYVTAHTLVALEALEAGEHETARQELRAALEWPESLGQGRPYQPEERLVRFLLGVTAAGLGDPAAARGHFQAVVDATNPSSLQGSSPTGLDLLAIASQRQLQSSADVTALTRATPTLFDDLDGRIILRALSLVGLR